MTKRVQGDIHLEKRLFRPINHALRHIYKIYMAINSYIRKIYKSFAETSNEI